MIILLTVVNVFNYMDRMAFAVLAPSIKAELNLSDGELGLLIGFAFALFYAVCGLPIARWADRGVRRDIIAASLATWSVMTALCGASRNFTQLFLARVGIGVGEAGGLSPAQSVLCDYVPFSRRSSVFAIHNFGLIVGMMLGMALAGRLGEILGWRWTFVVIGLPGVVLAVVVRLTLREPRREVLDLVKHEERSETTLLAVSELWRCKTYQRLTFYFVAIGFVAYGLNQWWPSYYVREYGLSLSSVGIYLGIALGVGSGGGVLIGGFLANKLGGADPALPLKVGASATAFAIPAALGSIFYPSAVGSILLASLTAMLWSVPTGPVMAALYSVTRPRLRATAGSFGALIQSVLGFGLGPFCVGLLSDLLAPSLGIRSLRYALLAPILLFPAMGLALHAASKSFAGDLRAIGVKV